MRADRAAWGAAIVMLVPGCHAFDDLEDCTKDTDCAADQRCHPTERYCERDQTPVTIGAVLPLSGELEDFGVDMERGLVLLAEQVNENGGILGGRPLEVQVLDDESDVPTSVDRVQALIDASVVGIVGPLTSGQALETQAVTYAAQVLQISPTAGTPELSTAQPARDRYFFRTISSVRSGSGAAISMFARYRGCDRMAVLHTDDAIGTGYRDAIEELFEKLGGCIVARVSYPPEELIEYDEQVAEMIDAAPGCATLVAFPQAGVEILAEFGLRTAGDPAWDDFFWVGTTTLHGDAFLEANEAHPDHPGEGLFIGDEDSTPDSVEYGELRGLFNERFDATGDLPIFVSNTYDAAMLIALAVEAAGTTRDRSAIRDGLWAVSSTAAGHAALGPLEWRDAANRLGRGDSIHYKGASSSLVFDEYGTVSTASEVFVLEGAEFTRIDSYAEQDIAELLAAEPIPPEQECP